MCLQSAKTGETLVFVDCKEGGNERLETHRNRKKKNKETRDRLQNPGREVISSKNTFYYDGKEGENFVQKKGKIRSLWLVVSRAIYKQMEWNRVTRKGNVKFSGVNLKGSQFIPGILICSVPGS